ncbi:MAG: nucleotide exchange factor GrpE [Vicinamibacterales bacterium]
MADEQDTAAGEAPPNVDPAAPAPDLDALRRERDDLQDRLMRKAAEFDNYRKRVERERREQADRAVVSLLEDLLAVVDDFDLALTVDAGEGGAAYRKGVEMIHAKLQDLLRRQGVKPIEALGTDFDPNLHEAVMQESSPGHRDNEVIAVLRKGYTLNDRLLRAASVKVARA